MIVRMTYMVRPALQEQSCHYYVRVLDGLRLTRRSPLLLGQNWWWGLWSCGREARQCGQGGDNPPNGLSPACPHVPEGAGRSVGLVHKSTGQIQSTSRSRVRSGCEPEGKVAAIYPASSDMVVTDPRALMEYACLPVLITSSVSA